MKFSMNTLQKLDWWKANAYLEFGAAGLILVTRTIDGQFMNGLISGAFEALLGYLLLRRSKIVFWILFALAAFLLVDFILTIARFQSSVSQIVTPRYFLVVIRFAFMLMLYQQQRSEKRLGRR